MSSSDQVDSFNPILLAIWATQLLLLGWDWSQDGKVLWSIPIIGSFFVIQLYMIWKTNYDSMLQEQRNAQAIALGGPIDTPEIDPRSTKLQDLYKTTEKRERDPKKDININVNQSENDQS
ncbi:MAG: hypothetical protein ACXAE3_15320 [Candidatus Kariarchaeaceae archaeon]|jgi:hypothetical protein